MKKETEELLNRTKQAWEAEKMASPELRCFNFNAYNFHIGKDIINAHLDELRRRDEIAICLLYIRQAIYDNITPRQAVCRYDIDRSEKFEHGDRPSVVHSLRLEKREKPRRISNEKWLDLQLSMMKTLIYLKQLYFPNEQDEV